jgi:flagella basal body P-ring formation protein FlgA
MASVGRLTICVFVALGVLAARNLPARGRQLTSKDSANSSTVVVSVRPDASVSEPQVTIGDVATLEGGTLQLRQSLAKLDLVGLSQAKPTATVLRDHIYYRLRLSDIDPKLFQVQGAPACQISLDRWELGEQEFVGAARRFLLQHLPARAEDLTVSLFQPLRNPCQLKGRPEDVRLDVDLHNNVFPLGKVRVDVVVWVKSERRAVVPLYLEVRLKKQVVVCTRRIERGEQLNEDNCYLDNRSLDTLGNYLGATELRAGRRVKKPLLTGQLVTDSDVEAVQDSSPLLVKQQQLVDLVAPLGPVVVKALGEALQDGRAGQLVRVRNVDSKIVVIGRVVERGVVQVDYRGGSQ